jgi:hypothetical protein
MPRQGKRPREVIDLTSDGDDGRRAKSPRYPSSTYSQPSRSTSSYLSPGSIAPPSQNTANDDDELGDLTQSNDGPPRELYGSLGMYLAVEFKRKFELIWQQMAKSSVSLTIREWRQLESLSTVLGNQQTG